MTTLELQNKIINLEYFFTRVAAGLKERAGFKRLCFLVPDCENGNYMTKYSTFGSTVYLTQKGLCRLNKDSHEDIVYPKAAMRRHGLLNRILLKIYWKMRLRSASAIMLIYRDGEIACLILFFDRLADDWLNSRSQYVSGIQRDITYCLEGITLYNQTLERLIREHNRHDSQPACGTVQLSNEQVPVWIGKKAEFL